MNIDGKLRAVTYGCPDAINIDPIEKKPLNHFLPGTSIFSIATVGCNLHCKNCQNWSISQLNPEDSHAYYLPPDRLLEEVIKQRCPSIAYTYTDPVVYYEYTLDASRLAHEKNIRNVLVTAGYINRKPLEELCKYVDAANIDLKGITDKFYRDICDATLKPVQEALVTSKSLGVLVEVTNLVIPTLNDTDKDIRALCKWIKSNMGADTPLHFSRFYPQHLMKHLPPTPANTLERARDIAKSEGLFYVYVGNIRIPYAGTTFCPNCGASVIRRRGYQVLSNRMNDGKCSQCGQEIYGVWK